MKCYSSILEKIKRKFPRGELWISGEILRELGLEQTQERLGNWRCQKVSWKYK
ncbi:hypothetical protein J2Z49_001522 [Desulfofundulus luciae]|uniref:Transposase n=1 Tax=Desulfofundulus luciae TaxID=74702 RepID=A0ABU0B103_9FIRM|nr:hypothetical protein [Desulfofundulus luciae]